MVNRFAQSSVLLIVGGVGNRHAEAKWYCNSKGRRRWDVGELVIHRRCDVALVNRVRVPLHTS